MRVDDSMALTNCEYNRITSGTNMGYFKRILLSENGPVYESV